MDKKQKQNLDIVYNMCSRECALAQQNIFKYTERAKQIYDYVGSKWDSGDLEACRLAYENTLSELIFVTDVLQKLNMPYNITTNIPENVTQPTKETERVQEKYTFPKARLEKYKPGYEAECILTFIKDANQKLFFITEIGNTEFKECISNMQKYFSENSHPIQEVPDEGQIFGIHLEGYMFRAVRENGISKDKKDFYMYLIDVGEEIIYKDSMKMYFLHADYQTMPAQAILCELKSINSTVETNLSKYLTSNLYVKHKFCVINSESGFLEVHLVGESNLLKREDVRQDVLDAKKTDPMSLKPISNPFKNYLHINISQYNNKEVNQNERLQANKKPSTAEHKSIEHSIISNGAPNNFKITQNNKLTNEFLHVSETNGFKSYEVKPKLDLLHANGMQVPNLDCNPNQQVRFVNNEKKNTVSDLTSQQLNILNEKPLCTTGYDPKDDKRICKFYKVDSESCFMGSQCRFEHVSKAKEGITMDIQSKFVYPKVGESITLFPSHIVNVAEFFAQIKSPDRYQPVTLKQLELKMNSPEHILLYKKMESPPATLELVLAIYREDRLYYRARVINVIDDDTVKVFYVDYGNSDIVKLRNVRKWEQKFSDLPFQAVHCRLFGINSKKSCSPEGTAELCKLILNQTLSAEVVYNIDQLYVRLFDSDGFEIADQLVAMDLAERNT